MGSPDAAACFSRVFGYLPRVVAVSPGRVELIGNHTDYNGGPVLGMTVDRTLEMGAAQRDDGLLQIFSASEGRVSPTAAESLLSRGPAWTKYIAGAWVEIANHGADLSGFDVAVDSNIPRGAGLSSSAALEVASALAISTLAGVTLNPEEVALLAWKVENQYVGVPCGLLDQKTVTHGTRDQAVLIDTADDITELVPLDPDLRLAIVVPPTPHTLRDGYYAKRREECRTAWEILQAVCPDAPSLARCSEESLRLAAARMPSESLLRARHVIRETERVDHAVNALSAADLPALGRLMTESHHSSRTLFHNSSPEQDALVDALAQHDWVWGARLTGGGFGGAVVALLADDRPLTMIQTALEEATGLDLQVLRVTPAPSAHLRVA